MNRFLWALAILIPAIFSSQTSKPNIVIIISDDHAFQAIGAYGSKFGKTPGIDRIASEGALFENAFVSNSLCGPSRAALLTGKFSHKNGFKDNENSNFNFQQGTFTKQLQKVGYQTAWIGKMHLGENTPEGFNYYNILPDQGQYYNPDFIEIENGRKNYTGYVTDVITQLSEDWLDKNKDKQPFCLVIGHKATHRTWMPSLADLGKYDHVTFPLPETYYDNYDGREAAKVQDMRIDKTLIDGYDLKMFSTEEASMREGSIKRMLPDQKKIWDAYYNNRQQEFASQKLSGRALSEWKFQQYMRDYFSTALSLDRSIAEIQQYLDRNNLTQNTIVIYLSDQGFYLGEHGWFDKRFMYEQSFRTPFVMKYPNTIAPGKRIKNFVMNVDIAPTLLQAAGAEIPADMQGKSFLNSLKSEEHKNGDVVYYHYYENGEHHVSPHFGVRSTRYKIMRFYDIVESWELYDLKKDPDELNNLFGKRGQKALTRKMKNLLLQNIRKYQDTEAEQIFNKQISKTKH